MEKNDVKNAENQVGNKKNKANKGITIFLVIIVLAMGAAIGILLSQMSDHKKKSAEVQEILETQKNELVQDLTDLQDQFGNLQTNNDSLQQLAVGQQEKITKLLAIQADNAYKVRTYQKELSTLREVLKSYIMQIDSLNTRNMELTADNTALTNTLAQERAQRERLSEDKDRLTSTVQKAQVLSVSDIAIQGLNSRSRETERVRNIEKLKICFTVRENAVAQAGERTFFLVIVKPDKKVLANKAGDTFTSQSGGQIIYTDKRSIEYENKDIELCIFSDNNNQLTAGKYEANVYCEGYLIRSAEFSLK